MATFSNSTPISQATDADFRAWITEFSNALTSVGLIQTSDTGQINKATVVRATVNTDAGYEIFRFNDAPQSSGAPIFIKFFYGSGASANTQPRLRVQIGNATDGAGNFVGFFTSIRTILNSTLASTVTNYPTRISYQNGSLNIAFKIGLVSGASTTATNCGFICIFRSMNNSGVLTSESASLLWTTSSTTSTVPACDVLNYSQGVAYDAIHGTSSLSYCLPFIGRVNGQTFNGQDTQVFRVFAPNPLMIPSFSLVACVKNEWNDFSTFQTQTVGTTTRTFLVLPANTPKATDLSINSTTISGNGPNSVNFAILWE